MYIANLLHRELEGFRTASLYARGKRALDVVGAIALAPVVVPLVGLLALLIRIDSPGPALFFQWRAGLGGKPFRIVKLRTMHVQLPLEGIEERREAAMTRPDDRRITRIGGFLRKRRLDELPQIWNVLVGEMSWVGPRPEAVELAEWHAQEIPLYSCRYLVRPGVTGLSQVNQGHVTELELIRVRLGLEIHYLRHMSPWLDATIALKTLRVMLSGRGAR